MDANEIIKDLLNRCILEFKKDENFERIKSTFLDPCVEYLVKQFYPYIITTCIIFILTFIIVISILALMIMNNKTPKI